MQLSLSVKDKSIETSGITKDYKEALCEFIWNSFEANATEVEISYTKNELSGINTISISDNGDGIVYEDIADTFGTFLASKKNSLSLMKSKANKGKGRFSFTAIASEATWKTVYKQGDNYLLFNIFLSNSNKNLVDYNDPKISDEKETGTTITLSNIIDLLPENISMLHLEDTLLKEYAWFLYLNKNDDYRIIINGEKLDYSKYINVELSQEKTIIIEDYSFSLNLIVWLDKIKEKYCSYYLDSSDTVKGKDTTTFNRNTMNYNHSMFVCSEFFNHLDDISLDSISAQTGFYLSLDDQRIIKELKKEIHNLIQNNLRDYMSGKADEVINKMINERKTFPTFKDDKYDQLRKQDLINVTKELYCLDSRIFYKLKPVQEKSLLGFLNLLLDSEERERILDIVEQIIELTPEQREDFSNVLKKTKLENIIETMKFIEGRYSKLDILKKIVFDLGKFANERDNIQKIVENNYWLFGEQYNLATADKTMATALKEYNYILYGAKTPTTKLEHDDENDRRMDIFMCNARKVESDSGIYIDENIIVELKAPRIPLSNTVYRQIEDYMLFIRKQPSFNSIRRQWKFIAVCSVIDDDVKVRYDAFKEKGKPGLVMQADNYEIYALTWDDVFKSFELRHSFILDKLKMNREEIAKELFNNKTQNEKQMVSELTQKAISRTAN